jgi:hypothetical protein
MVSPSPTSSLCSLGQELSAPRRELSLLLDSISHRFATDPARDPMLPSLLGCLVLHLEEELHRATALSNRADCRREQIRLIARANDLAVWSRRAGSQAEAWALLAAGFSELHAALITNFLAPP